MKRIPIKVAMEVGKANGFDQVILLAWERRRSKGLQHVVTWGRTVVDCDQAAQGGNRVKDVLLGWPKELCGAEPDRVRKLKARIKELEKRVLYLENAAV